ncbi:MAG: hypothetical protein ABR949_05730 [Candidatus Aquilonibacter sp.]|jgi:hypothetical protein
MPRRLSLIAFLAVAAFLNCPVIASATTTPARVQIVAYAQITMFATEDAAQTHCPRDTVVWLNTKTGIWHEKGMRWYGRTKQGAYVCRKEAAAAGYRDTRNGQ